MVTYDGINTKLDDRDQYAHRWACLQVGDSCCEQVQCISTLYGGYQRSEHDSTLGGNISETPCMAVICSCLNDAVEGPRGQYPNTQ